MGTDGLLTSVLLISEDRPLWLDFLPPIIMCFGVLLFWGAVKDPSGYFTDWYEDHKNSMLGFWFVSRSARQFRIWHGLLGLWFFGIGLTALIFIV